MMHYEYITFSNFAKVLYFMRCNSTWYFDRQFIGSVQISSGLASLQRYRRAHNCRYSFWGQNTSRKFSCQGKSGQLVIPDECFLLSIFALICMKQKSIRINIIYLRKTMLCCSFYIFRLEVGFVLIRFLFTDFRIQSSWFRNASRGINIQKKVTEGLNVGF